jgi:hypothetical protein
MMIIAQIFQYRVMRILIKILLRLLPDNTLCLFEEESFKEMEKRGFIIWEKDINSIEQN